MNLEEINKELQNKSPEEIINWAITIAYKPIVTTNFRPYEVAILDAVTAVQKEVTVVWCDTGYNTQQTYKHAEEIIKVVKENQIVLLQGETGSGKTTQVPQMLLDTRSMA